MSIILRMFSDGIDWVRLSGHLYQQETTWTEKIISFNIDGPTYQDRPKLRWRDVVNTNLHKKHLNISLASDGLMDVNWEMPSDQWHSKLHSNPLWVEQGDETTSKQMFLNYYCPIKALARKTKNSAFCMNWEIKCQWGSGRGRGGAESPSMCSVGDQEIKFLENF